MTLTQVQARVLGALIEKEIATPEAYPLSLNALLNACNQRSSREPVMDLDEEQVRQAVHGLEELELVSTVRDARVAKFEHRARTVLHLRRDETAILCLLLLRGPQTPGELRSRADRLYAFDGLEAVESTLNRLAARPIEPGAIAAADPLALIMPRQPGAREARWSHLLSGPAGSPATQPAGHIDPASPAPNDTLSRLDAVEAELARLQKVVAALEARITRSKGISSDGTAL